MRIRDRKKSRRALSWVLAVTGLAAGILFFYFRIYKVEPAFSQITWEYGEQVSRNIEDYLIGTEWSVHLARLDLSQVDEGHTGTYQALVQHGKKEFTYEVTIQDTIAPEIHWREGEIYLALGRQCQISDVIDGVSDVDVEAEAFFLQEGNAVSNLAFGRIGKYDLNILARDSSGNETKGQVSVTVDTPPSFQGIRDFYCVLGEEPDYREAVSAQDTVDGDLTSAIQVDDSGVDLGQEGDYTLHYVAEDQYGLETVESARVLVADEDGIQALIGKRKIDYRKDAILGAPNIYDAGVSSYSDIDETLDYIRPSLVQLYHGVGRSGYTSGSGYIMEIAEDRIYICSNNHVVGKYEDWDIYFYDGTVVPGKAVGISRVYDVGVVEVALEDVPQELLEKLMTVHIDRTYWEGLNQQDIDLGLERVDREGGLLHVSKGKLLKVKQEFDWNTHEDHTEVTLELVHGDSGSAVLDGYGNLICMAYAYSTDPVRYWCIPLDGILRCYREITGRMPYVY